MSSKSVITRKQNLQANSRSACQFWHKREKEAQRLFMKLHYSLSTPRGEIELIFALRAAVSDTQANFQNGNIWAWNLAIGQTPRSCAHSPFSPHGGEIELIFYLSRLELSLFLLYGQRFLRYWLFFFKIANIWAWNFVIGKSSRSCT